MPVTPLAAALPSILALALAAPAQAAPPKPAGDAAALPLSLVRGGEIGTDPVVVGTRAYLATGRVVSSWNYAHPARPLREGTSLPVDGVINGLAHHGDHLYASWRGYDSTGGVAVFSLADPAAPELVWQGGYTDNAVQYATGIAVANGHLYVFDSDYGVFLSDLSDPAAPAFTPAPGLDSATFYNRVQNRGNLIHASGRNWFGNLVFDTYDASQPLSPQKLSSHTMQGTTTVAVVVSGDTAVGAGHAFSTFDIAVPGELERMSSQEIYGAMSAAIVGRRAYSFGFEGLATWDIRDLAAPRQIGENPTPTLGARNSATLGHTLLVPTATDLLHAFNTRPALPSRFSSSWLPGGTAPFDVAEHDGRLVLLQNGYGLTVNDAQTLSPLARFEADLPQALQARAFEGLDVAGDTAYLASWGSGLVTVDLSGAKPVELGRLEYPFLSGVTVAGDRAYAWKATNGIELVIVDVADPSAPSAIASMGLWGGINRLEVSDGHAFIAESAGEDAGGLRVYSLADPDAPAQVAHLDQGCDTAWDLSIDAERDRLYLACELSLQVIDIAQPASPQLLGSWVGGQEYSQFNKVAHHGDRAWFSDDDGLHEIDVTDPAQPALVATTGVGRRNLQRLLALDDGRLAAVGSSGTHLFGEAAPAARATGAGIEPPAGKARKARKTGKTR